MTNRCTIRKSPGENSPANNDKAQKIITKIKPDRWKVQHPNGSWTTHESLKEAEEYELPVFEEIEPF